MKNKRWIIITGLVAILIVTGYFFLFAKGKETVNWETTEVKKGNLSNTVTATGTLEAITTVEVGTQVSGVIQHIYVDYNTHVKKGQLIAELDKTSLKAALSEAKANMESATNELDYQEKNYKRIKALYDNKVVSETDYETALYNYNKAKASFSMNKSQLQRAETNLSYASIYSPIDGIVLSRAVDEGQTVAASFSTPTLFTIANDLTKLQVQADVDEADIGQVKDSERVTFTVDAFPDEAFSGKVTQVRLEPVVTNNVVTYTVIIDAPNKDMKLMPGMTASITIFTQEENNTLVIPAKATRFQPDQQAMESYFNSLPDSVGSRIRENTPQEKPMTGTANNNQGTPTATATGSEPENDNIKTVWIKQGEMVKPTRITTGISDGINTQVISGLKEGEAVVVNMTVNGGTQEGTASTAAARSPFMPQPPGRSQQNQRSKSN